MSGMGDRNRETPGIEAPGPIDRALDKDRDDRIDILEGDKGTGTRRASASGERAEYVEGEDREVRVPVVEEQLQVGKREVDLGEVEIRRRVIEEEQSVPVTLRREEVHVQEVDTPDRPLRAGEDAFEEGTIRVGVRGEEAVVAKEAVVTGEVVVDKDVTQEQRTVSDTVRRTEVDFDENYRQARPEFEQHHASSGMRGRSFEESEGNYRSGFMAGSEQRYAGREFEDVEPELRSQYETTRRTSGTGMAGRTGSAGSSGMSGGDSWEHLREQVRTGFNRARNRR